MSNVPAGHDYQGGFSVSLMNKDVTYGTGLATDTKLELPLIQAAQKLYHKLASNENYKNKDFSSYFQYLEKN
jgi:3-hydroxyisobutyrate dehydrogenase-like beta-hydroxyacid dehydrogenase